MNSRVPSLLILCCGAAVAADPLPVSKSFWQDEGFVNSFNGSYRIEARIEPVVTSDERGLLVEVQKLMAAGERAAALAKVKASALTKGSAALLFNLGNLHFEEGEMDEAAAAYAGAIAKYPAFRRAHRNLGLVCVREGEVDKALESLVEAMRLGDADATTYGMLGYCRLQRGEHASALQAYRMAQLAQPESIEWKAGVAQCLQHLDARDEAVALLDEVVRQRPDEPAYAVLQASLLIELERPDDAVKALDLPRRLGKLDADGLILLAELHLRAGRVESAKVAIDEAFAGETAPSTDRSLGVIAAAMARGEWELARGVIDRATPAEGAVPPALRRLSARLSIESGDGPEAGAAALRELLSEDPTDGASLLALGKYELSRDQPELAETLLERATRDAPVSLDAWIELARLHVAAGRHAKALEAVDQALALRPTDDLRRYREALAGLAEAAR